MIRRLLRWLLGREPVLEAGTPWPMSVPEPERRGPLAHLGQVVVGPACTWSCRKAHGSKCKCPCHGANHSAKAVV